MEVQGADEQKRCVPLRTRADLERREAAEDHEALLMQKWCSYAASKGYPESPERTKWRTETWEAFEKRKEIQSLFLERHGLRSEKKAAQLLEIQKMSEQQSAAAVNKIMAFEASRKSALQQSRHFLCVDYYDYQQFLFGNQRFFIEEEEKLLRSKLSEVQDDFMFSLATQFHIRDYLVAARERQRKEEEEAAKRIREAEYQRKLEEEARLEEERAAQEREAAKAEKERAEIEKRLERKRREEERRAKARAEREQRKAQE
ncbi:hypothetical protein JKF63_05714 [Porcisia hertigi]|uniref:Uncharacterized protein n=1 Tax=Porcisia hertigi TaxID=2761500 RepID=A0A836LHS7_9TRYP|nr:hypothetical protein JKF63_05714 [Porcisia hertigi]